MSDEREDAKQLRELVTAIGWPVGKGLPAADVFAVLARLGAFATRRGATQLAEQIDDVIRDPDSPDRLYALGYALIDAGVPTVAASVLWRCLALVGDSEEVVCELVSALESALAYPDAVALLEEHAALRSRSFLAQYLYGFNAAMSGNLALTRTVHASLAPDSPETTAMHATLAGMIARADRVAGALPLDDRDLRGWHYVLTGGLLLHQSPYGYDEPMHGRFAWLTDSVQRIAFGIERLATLVEPLALPCIYAPPGRSHAIVATAASTRLGLPIAEWPAIGVPAPGLVVAYDLADLSASVVAQLAARRAEQVLFVHASPWTQDSIITPDVTTLLYQVLVAPWDEAEVDPASVLTETLPPDDLAADEPERWAALVERAWPPTPGSRSRLWAGGPVSSNRFT